MTYRIDFNDFGTSEPEAVRGLINSLIQSEHNRTKKRKLKGERSRKMEINNVKFDSILEAKRGVFLMWAQDNGYITDLVFQPTIELLPPMTYFGRKLRKMEYTPDFKYTYDNKEWYEEVKGWRAEKTYKIRLRLAVHLHPEWRFVLWFNERKDYLFPDDSLININRKLD